MRSRILCTMLNNGINAIFPIVIIPILTQKLTPDAFGSAVFVLTVYATALAVSQLGFDAYGLRELSKVKGIREESASIYSELILGHILVIILVVAIMAALKLMGLLGVHSWVLCLVMLTLLASAFQTDWALFANGKFGSVLLRNLIVKTLAVCAVLQVLHKEDTGTTYVAIVLFSYIVSSLWTFALVNKFLSLTAVSVAGLAKRLHAIKPFIISRVMSAFLQHIDILVVGAMCKPEETGFYFIARKVTQAGCQCLSHIVIVFNNQLYLSSTNKEAKGPCPLKGLDLTTFLSLFTAVFISFNGTAIMEILSGQSYLIMPELLGVLSIMIVTHTVANHIGLNVLYFFGKDYAVTKSLSLSAGFLAVTLILVTGKFGIYGVAVAFVLANLLMMVIHLAFSRRLVANFSIKLVAAYMVKPILIVASLIILFLVTSLLGISYTTLSAQMVLANFAIASIGLLTFFFKQLL